jgi:hypothetical protein
MKDPPRANPFPPGWHNYHYDGHHYRIASSWPEPDRKSVFKKLQSLLSRLTVPLPTFRHRTRATQPQPQPKG